MNRQARRRAHSLTKPTDRQIVDKLLELGVRDYVSVPCSITASIHDEWADLARNSQISLIQTTHEHNLVGIAAGIHLGTGRLVLVHMQNSGFTNAADGMISFASVYKIPGTALVTWRGSNIQDDSEPHQAIGHKTNALTRAVLDGQDIHGTRLGRGILPAIDRAVADAREGRFGVFRLSPDAFRVTHPPTLPTHFRRERAENLRTYSTIVASKGTDSSAISPRSPISRDEAIQEIVRIHRDAAILFSNGFTARAAQGCADRVGNFYNVGYMGGTLAIGWALARSNPGVHVVVVDGDQNAQMSNMINNLADDYPANLNWYILDNRMGASVGTAASVPLAPLYFELARVIPTRPDEFGSFLHPRVGGKGAYFDTDEANEMACRIGSLPVHARRFADWIKANMSRQLSNSKATYSSWS
jgi:phosphonopyruvate decarboxylase